jgi:hypothetical protein
VDVAAREKDPLRRVAFVAAFAMANYSSTIGRIAKPFNPMLVGLVGFLKLFFYITTICRAKLLNMSVWIRIIDTCLSKSAIILLFPHVGQKVLCGIITARYVIFNIRFCVGRR